jgi:hypothetical protein
MRDKRGPLIDTQRNNLKTILNAKFLSENVKERSHLQNLDIDEGGK